MDGELTRDQAGAVLTQWDKDDGRPICDYYLPGMFDIRLGERKCRNCRAPESVHTAKRLVSRA